MTRLRFPRTPERLTAAANIGWCLWVCVDLILHHIGYRESYLATSYRVYEFIGSAWGVAAARGAVGGFQLAASFTARWQLRYVASWMSLFVVASVNVQFIAADPFSAAIPTYLTYLAACLWVHWGVYHRE